VANTPKSSDDIPSGATMQPRYMGRTMITYPISESEMEQISSLSGQVTMRLSTASLFFGLAGSIWTNAIFVNEMTPLGHLATYYMAPFFLIFSGGHAIAAYLSHRKRTSAWDRIRQDASPMQTVAEARSLMVSGSRSSVRKS